MAQRTAFLNSDAKGYNKDFHHTWIHNYLLHQVGVMFTDYNTKNEFKLGNGQISGGKAIIRCTRTTGNFAGSQILALFESTATESISTSGDKKVFIEIPEIYVNDSTAITDTLTQGLNLGVGVIKSEADYPSHTNYIPLWEITGGDWEQAVDVRPEILRRGKPNTISYFGGNGEEESIDIDNESLNKFLMSNGAGNRPTWEEGTGGGGGSGENFKRTFTADEDLLAKSMFGVETLPTVSNIDASIEFGTTEIEKLFFTTILNGEDFSSIVLNLKSVNSPSDSLSIRIETLDANGKPSGTLVDVGAYGTVSPTSTATDTTISLSGTVTGLTAHTKVAVVISRSGTASDSNYYELGCLDDTNVITAIQEYDGSVWSGGYVSGCITCAGFASDAVVQATSLNGVEPVGYCETGATAGNDFTGILEGTVDYSGAESGKKYYLSNTGTLSTSGNKQVGVGIQSGVISLFGYEEDGSSNSSQITATAAINMNKGAVVYMRQSDGKVRPTGGQRGFTSTEFYLGGVTPDGASQSNVGLKTVQITSTQALSVFTSNSGYITLCLSDGDLSNFNPVVTDYRCSGAFDVCSPKDGYAAIIYRDKSTQYPSVFMVKVSDDATTALSVSASVTVLENYAIKGGICVGVTKLQDTDANMFCALWTRNYKESSAETLDGKTRYCICSFSGLTITTGTLDIFQGNINTSAHTAFGYLGNGLVGMVYSSGGDSNYNYTIRARPYSEGSFGGSRYETLDTRNSSGFVTGPQLLWLGGKKCLASIDGMCYICATYPDTYKLYSYNKVWQGGQQIRYYMVDGNKHLMKVDMSRNEDNTYGTLRLTKYKVGDASLVELKTWTYTLTDVNASYSMPQLTEIGDDNNSFVNDADGDYYIYYLMDSGIAHGESYSKAGMAIGVVKEDVQAGQLANIIVSGTAPGTFSAPGKQVYINGTYAGETESDYPIGISISTTKFIFNK